jgi:hypothetical protein
VWALNWTSQAANLSGVNPGIFAWRRPTQRMSYTEILTQKVPVIKTLQKKEIVVKIDKILQIFQIPHPGLPGVLCHYGLD